MQIVLFQTILFDLSERARTSVSNLTQTRPYSLLQLSRRWREKTDNVYDLNQLKGKHESSLNKINLSIHNIIADYYFLSVAKLRMKDNLYPIAKPFIYQ